MQKIEVGDKVVVTTDQFNKSGKFVKGTVHTISSIFEDVYGHTYYRVYSPYGKMSFLIDEIAKIEE